MSDTGRRYRSCRLTRGGLLDMDLIAALLATLAAGLFAGAAVAVYIAFVEHPARA